jgi:hypothetical protein
LPRSGTFALRKDITSIPSGKLPWAGKILKKKCGTIRNQRSAAASSSAQILRMN